MHPGAVELVGYRDRGAVISLSISFTVFNKLQNAQRMSNSSSCITLEKTSQGVNRSIKRAEPNMYFKCNHFV